MLLALALVCLPFVGDNFLRLSRECRYAERRSQRQANNGQQYIDRTRHLLWCRINLHLSRLKSWHLAAICVGYSERNLKRCFMIGSRQEGEKSGQTLILRNGNAKSPLHSNNETHYAETTLPITSQCFASNLNETLGCAVLGGNFG